MAKWLRVFASPALLIFIFTSWGLRRDLIEYQSHIHRFDWQDVLVPLVSLTWWIVRSAMIL